MQITSGEREAQGRRILLVVLRRAEANQVRPIAQAPKGSLCRALLLTVPRKSRGELSGKNAIGPSEVVPPERKSNFVFSLRKAPSLSQYFGGRDLRWKVAEGGKVPKAQKRFRMRRRTLDPLTCRGMN